MKRRAFIKHLEAHDCEIYAEGANHTKIRNTKTNKKTTLPRHTEIRNNFARDVCDQLGIEKIR